MDDLTHQIKKMQTPLIGLLAALLAAVGLAGCAHSDLGGDDPRVFRIRQNETRGCWPGEAGCGPVPVIHQKNGFTKVRWIPRSNDCPKISELPVEYFTECGCPHGSPRYACKLTFPTAAIPPIDYLIDSGDGIADSSMDDPTSAQLELEPDDPKLPSPAEMP